MPTKDDLSSTVTEIRGVRISEGKCTITYPSAFRRMLYAGDLVTSNLDDAEKAELSVDDLLASL